MRRFINHLTIALMLPLVSGCGQQLATIGSQGASGAAMPRPSTATRQISGPLGEHSIRPRGNGMQQAALCPASADSLHAVCFATVRTDGVQKSIFPDSVDGLTPSDLSKLYAYPAPGAQGPASAKQVVGIIIAGNYAKAESDLAVYRTYFGLPPCTAANGCFSTVGAAAGGASSQTGPPTWLTAMAAGGGWAAEADLDMDTISAICPNCHIMLVEAASDYMGDLGQAANAAVAAGATIINGSFGAAEANQDASFEPQFENGKHIKVVAAAGDWGPGVNFPAASGKVIAVAGTTLSVSGTTVEETLWSGSGYGCSEYFGKQGWQQNQVCHNRSVADVAADADPATGIAFYDSTLFGSTGGWAIVGGTSLAAAIITGVYALSGDTANGEGPQVLYQHGSSFRPIGPPQSCLPNSQQQCQATSNVPTGLGIPQGLAGF